MDESMQNFAQKQREVMEIYELLLTLADEGLFGEDYICGVDQLASMATDQSLAPYLLARFHYEAKDYPAACQCMEKALFYRAIDFTYWDLMRRICEKLGDKKRQYYYASLLNANKQFGGALPVPMDDPEALRIIGQAQLNPCSVPFYLQFFYKDGELKCDGGNLAGQYLESQGQYRPYCGVYNSRGWLNMRGKLAALLSDNHVVPHGYCEFPFEVMKCIWEKQVQVECPPGQACILPIAVEEYYQPLSFRSGDTERQLRAGQWEFAFYRLEGKVEINSPKPFQVAAPIWLGHKQGRRQLVLNILADGLSWQVMKKQGYKAVPNILKFFSKGIIFDHNFSVSEYTYPSLATIETSCYPYRSQIFNDMVPTHLDSAFVTLSEQMKDQGYYCANLMCDSAGIYNGVLRGFDRNIIDQTTCHAYEGVHRCIEHLDAFRETDNYVFLHLSDAHPFNSNVQLAAHTQTVLPWQERILTEYDNSVFKKKNVMNMADNQYNIRQLDRYLGFLFAYLEENYAEDEYVVNLFSDHGVSVYDDKPYLLSENQSGAAMMMRGAGVSELGLVEELTSVLDLYPIMGKLLGFDVPDYIDGRLPKALGGAGRQYAASMSIYPGQTFKLCLRDCQYEFRLETEAFTEISGRVDMTAYQVHIYRRLDGQEVFEDKIRARFMEEAWKHIQSFAYFKGEDK